MKEYEQKDWHEDIEFLIVFPKRSFRERLWKFFRDLLGQEGFTESQKRQLALMVGMDFMQWEGFMNDNGQVFQDDFINTHKRFCRLEWVFYRFINVAERNYVAQWLQLPNEALDGLRPIDCISDDIQFQKLKDVIFRLEYGIFG